MEKTSYLSKKGYVLKKEEFTKDELFEIKKELRGRPLTDNKFTKATGDTSFSIYIETKNKLYIPKMYGIEKFGIPKTILDNYSGKEWDYTVNFTGSLYENQIEPVQELINSCKSKGGGILSLQTGGGKSICLLNVLSHLKVKTIIVVNKITLLKQWESEINKFLPEATVGILQGQKNIDVNKDIIIAMLQSLSRIDYSDEIFNNIGCCVIDEIHHLGSELFSKILFKITSKYSIGLSATPKRGDGCEYVFKWHIGDIVYKSLIERKGKAPIIKLLKIDSSEYKEISSINRLTGQNTIQFTSMLSDLIEMEKRNKLIIEIIKRYYTLEKRKILVLSDRRNHLLNLKNILELSQVSFTYGLFIGSMKVKDLEKSKACDIILATFASFSEGVSEKDLDTLILCTPKKFIGHLKNITKNESGTLEQIVGRIFRKEHIGNHPMIIDFQDNFSIYKTQASSRTVFYKSHFKNVKFENQSINLDDHKIENITYNCIKITKVKEIKETPADKDVKNLITKFCIIDD